VGADFGDVGTPPELGVAVRSKTVARSRKAEIPPAWTSVLAVIAHPVAASAGLGAILDAFILAQARVEVLCLTHGQAWTLEEASGDLATLRGAELASGTDVLGPVRVTMQDCPDGALGELCQTKLAHEVVAKADSCHPDGLLVFDARAVPGQLDHVSARSVGLLAAQTLDLPVLGWTLSETVAHKLRREFGVSVAGHQDEQVTCA
jgi:LmbE family N-acetylglucosaminyl deacetylase